jgi:hypothetical protein
MLKTLLKYMDIEFDGDNITGMNCARFAEHFRREEYGRETPLAIPSYAKCIDDLEAIFDFNIENGIYKETKTPVDGDLFLMSNRAVGKWHHLGVYLNRGVIHCTEHSGNRAGVQWCPVERIGRLFPYYTAYTEKDG